MSSKESQKESLIYYLLGRLPFDKMDKDLKKWVKSTVEIEDLRKKLMESMKYIDYYAAKGQFNLIEEPIEELEKILLSNNLYFPEKLKNEIKKIALLNGIPMEYKYLSEALEKKDGLLINKHWKIFGNYIKLLQTLYENEQLDEGTRLNLHRWLTEYKKLEEILIDPFHLFK